MDFDLEEFEPESFEDKIKYKIWCQLVDYIDSTDYTQAELAEKLCVYQSDVSNLLNGREGKFSTDKLIRYAGKLDLKVRCELLTRGPTGISRTTSQNHFKSSYVASCSDLRRMTAGDRRDHRVENETAV